MFRRICLPAMLAAALGTASPALADWPKLADGRTVIKIKGEKFTMPADGASLLGITFALRQTGGPKSLTLGEVLAKPDEARAAFERASSVRIDIPNIAERTDRWLGRFDRKLVKIDAVSIETGGGVAEDCIKDAASLNGLRAKSRGSPEDGWAEFVSERAPRDYTYVKSPRATALPDHFDSVRCNYHVSCRATACVREDVAFTYRFNRELHPRAEWNEVVALAGDVMRYLVPAGPR